MYLFVYLFAHTHGQQISNGLRLKIVRFRGGKRSANNIYFYLEPFGDAWYTYLLLINSSSPYVRGIFVFPDRGRVDMGQICKFICEICAKKVAIKTI